MSTPALIVLLRDSGVKILNPGEHHHARAGWYGLDCPFCSPRSGKFLLGISAQANVCNCWKCGRHAPGETVAALLGVPIGEAVRRLRALPRGGDSPVQPRHKPVSGKLELPRGLGPLLRPHCLYLRRRGFDTERLVNMWKIQGIGCELKLAWRIFIPIHYQGQLVSWTTRSIDPDARLRYVSAGEQQEILPHKTLLYGADKADSVIVIVEGPIDAWAIGPGAVATCGTSYCSEQVLRMSEYPTRVVCFDNEPAAQRRASELSSALSVFPGKTMVVTLDAKDAATASPEEITKLRVAVGL